MKDTLSGAELVEHWRDGGQDNPAGPLFAAGIFAEADITSDCGGGPTHQCGTACSGSLTRECC
jgi:Family of unknown function (DUF6229)